MDIGSSLGTILGTILNYKRDPSVHFKGPLMKLILTVAHISVNPSLPWSDPWKLLITGCERAGPAAFASITLFSAASLAAWDMLFPSRYGFRVWGFEILDHVISRRYCDE